jgi:hypothetical protein
MWSWGGRSNSAMQLSQQPLARQDSSAEKEITSFLKLFPTMKKM